MTQRDQSDRGSSIGAVERDTGLSKDTLRVWERRYGFPRPGRDASGERAYLPAEVEKLRVIKRLIDQGHRPGKIIEKSLADLQQLAQNGDGLRLRGARRAARPVSSAGEDLEGYLDDIKTHRIGELRNRLAQALMRVGFARFITTIVAPLTERVGDAWMQGRFEVFEEHLYTEALQTALRNAINAIPPPRRSPDVLLTTFPQEAHSLGMLMAEAMFALEGCRCVSLGTQTPVPDIVAAAAAHRSDIVALSFSSVLGPNPVLDGLAELRARLPAPTEIWAGGSSAVLQRRPPAGVQTFTQLEEIGPAIARWRAAR
jgi:DNA-binding transcriptional MerR regulator